MVAKNAPVPTLLPDALIRQLFGARLAVMLRDREISQAVLAEQLEVDRSTVSRICSGERSAKPGQIRSICILLNIDPALLLGL